MILSYLKFVSILLINNLIYDSFGVTFSSYLSLSSLAFELFRANYLGGHLSSIIDGSLYRTIQEGYVGGTFDVYKPRPGVLDDKFFVYH